MCHQRYKPPLVFNNLGSIVDSNRINILIMVSANALAVLLGTYLIR